MSIISNPAIITKDAAVTLLNGSTKPVIFWDTCALLDIIRFPIPGRNQSVGRLEKVMEIRQKIVNGDIISLASVLTVREYNDHVGQTQKEVQDNAKRISREHNNYMEFVHRVNPPTPANKIDLEAYQLEVQLSDIVQDITQATKFIDRASIFLTTAETRVIMKIPPAKMKGEFKDCYIWSTCLEVRKASLKTGNPFGFLSSNTRDYAVIGTTDFDPGIQAEADAVMVIYYPNFDVAYGSLRTAGIV